MIEQYQKLADFSSETNRCEVFNITKTVPSYVAVDIYNSTDKELRFTLKDDCFYIKMDGRQIYMIPEAFFRIKELLILPNLHLRVSFIVYEKMEQLSAEDIIVIKPYNRQSVVENVLASRTGKQF